MIEHTNGQPYETELRVACELAQSAGRAALKFYGTSDLQIEIKDNNDEPVTEADHAANEIIVTRLLQAFPADGLLSEESVDTVARLDRARVWMIDPLDGTNGFIDGNGDFAVQIGLIEDGQPVLGVVYAPVPDVLYWAARGSGAWALRPKTEARRQLHVSSERNLTVMRLAVSRSHRSRRMDQVVRALKVKSEVQRGSVGIKVGLIIENYCDLYVHLSPRSKQWDTCAPEAILREAGGRLTDLFGVPLPYNSPDVRNVNGIVATNGVSHDDVIKRLQPLLREFGRVPM